MWYTNRSLLSLSLHYYTVEKSISPISLKHVSGKHENMDGGYIVNEKHTYLNQYLFLMLNAANEPVYKSKEIVKFFSTINIELT